MILLDTNVISELMHVAPEPKVVAWIDGQLRSSIWTSSITIFEVTYELELMPPSKKQATLRNSFETLLNKLEDRIAVFDPLAAQKAANLMAARQKRGQPRDLRDTMIAGIVLAKQATLATHNTSHFDDIAADVIDPWKG